MLLSEGGTSTDFEPAPEGNHVARCVSIIDLGTQRNDYQGDISHTRKFFFTWELPQEMKTYDKDGTTITEPFTVTEFYTASLGKKANLRRDLESWRGRAFTADELAGFSAEKVLGAPCMLNVIHKVKANGNGTNAKIVSVNAMPKGVQCPDQVNTSVYFDLDNFDEAVFEGISKGLKGMIEKSPEFQAAISSPSAPAVEAIAESDIPF